ncbi:UvrD-helicase domain-containing protein [Virgibacillus ihumii]|uniref:UvrD-helicase domain-containing protein n=1 Tax=Virgibacillus ihumii TaxID=2686091 RepID=UPI00157D94EF|nr:ATP-dependent helicase [Virgibacillus ihumii]
MENYSTLIFQMDLDEQVTEELVSLLKCGTKVFFFTYDPIDMLLENEVIEQAVDFKMFFGYEVMFHDDFQEPFRYFDGEVPSEILQFLDSKVDYFNKEQFLIEHAPVNEHISVSAGAGTGKTTVMLDRIMFLKYKHPDLDFSELGLITFTNKAANNMREKLIQKIKDYFKITNNLTYLNWLQELKNMSIGTIHSFAHQVLNLNKDNMFVNKDIRLSRFTYKRRKIIESVIDNFHEENPQLFSKFKYIEQYRIIGAVESVIDLLGNYSIAQEIIQEMDFGRSDDDSHLLFEYVVKETLRRLEEYKTEVGYIGVNDLITGLESLKLQSSSYQIPFKYIFIDEFQDTDRQQAMFFSFLANTYPVSLFVVGDVKQSIYRFRGADYTAFEQLKGQIYIHQEYFLQLNYRSDKELLGKLNSMFKTWPNHVNAFKFDEKDYLLSGFESKNQLDIPLVKHSFPTKVSLINFLREIESTNTAVLVRSNREVNELSSFCEENKIYFTSDQDGDFYRINVVREFYQLIKRFTHPNVWSNRYLLHLSSYGERDLEIANIVSEFDSDRMYIKQLLENKDWTLNQFANQFQEEPVFEVLQKIIRAINPAKVYAERFIAEKPINSFRNEVYISQAKTLRDEYQLNLDHLIYLLKEEFKGTIPSLGKILRVLELKMNTDKTVTKLTTSGPDSARLSIMTVHKAKGLEFDYVFLPYTDRGFKSYLKTDVVINQKSIGYRAFILKGKIFKNDIYNLLRHEEIVEEVGEETRLLYVALTRAKKGVYFKAPENSHSVTAKKWGDLIAKGLESTTAPY